MSTRRRRILVFALSALAVFFFALLVFHSRTDQPGSGSEGEIFGFDAKLHVSPLPSTPEGSSPSAEAVATGTPATDGIEPRPTGTPGVQPLESADVDKPDVKARTRSARSFFPIGVVDLDKLLRVHPPENTSPEARANAIAEIQRATESSAVAHDCDVVLDVSGNSRDGVPVVLFAAETLDLTGEVIQRLRQ